MNVSALYHPCYGENLDLWESIEDVCQGGRTIKKKGVKYLPKLDGETDDEYKNRKLRAVFFNATKRTREALIGMLMRKPPIVTVPKEMDQYMGDVDMEGSTITNYVRTVVSQVVSTGRGVTVAEWSDIEKRPYLAFYPAVNVINWATERVGGRAKLTLLTLKECSEKRVGSQVEAVTQFREYSLDPVFEGEGEERKDTGRRILSVKVWEEGKDSNMGVTEQRVPTRKGKPLEDIPAVFHNATHLGASVGDAPLSDVADLNLHHYNGSADLENGRHICGIPTPYATGISDTLAEGAGSGTGDQELKLGSTKAWTASDPQAKFGFIEFTGQGLGALVTGQVEKERQMAVLGARLLFDNKKDAESYETVKLRSVSENATLSNMSGFLTATLTVVVRLMCWWDGTMEKPSDLDDKIGIVVNDDFIDTPMQPTMLTSLVAALQSNSISPETFFHQLQKGEIYPDGWDLKQETAAIANRPPTMAPPAPPTPPAPNDDPNPEDEE